MVLEKGRSRKKGVSHQDGMPLVCWLEGGGE